MAKIAINGLGRIGRAVLKQIVDTPELELVAVNDLIPAPNLAYLLKYDTVYGRYPKEINHEENALVVNGKTYQLFHEKDPAQLPWKELGIDIVFECTGIFRKREDLQKHIQAGARFVILSAPAKSEDVETIVYGVNVGKDKETRIISCASCTTNCITPIVEIMGRRIGIHKAIMTTIHAYTSSQEIVDGYNKDMRRGRAGAENFVPTSTGAAIATTKALPQYKGLFDGVAVRGPIPVGSIADLVFVTSKKTSVEELTKIFKEEASSEKYKNVLDASSDPLVSSDIIQSPYASIVDLEMIQVVDGDLVKIMSWYDNEWGYSAQMVRQAVSITKKL